MRSDNVYNNVNMVVAIDGKEIKRIKKRHLAPGEMEAVKIKREDLLSSEHGVISVSLEGEGA